MEALYGILDQEGLLASFWFFLCNYIAGKLQFVMIMVRMYLHCLRQELEPCERVGGTE